MGIIHVYISNSALGKERVAINVDVKREKLNVFKYRIIEEFEKAFVKGNWLKDQKDHVNARKRYVSNFDWIGLDTFERECE